MLPISIKQVMTTAVVFVHPETPLIEAAQLIADRGLNGVPVVDKTGILVGIVTEYNLISKGSALHLPTLQAVLADLPVIARDKSEFSKDVQGITSLLVKDVMDVTPLTLSDTATF